MDKASIVHIITGLNSGGAEQMLYKLLLYSNKSKYKHTVISMIDKGVYGDKIELLGIEVHYLKLNKIKNIIPSLVIARNICSQADVIQTWMYHADLYGFITGKILLKKKLIWGLHHSNLDKRLNKNRTLFIAKLNCFLSRKVDAIVSCSNQAKKIHSDAGMKEDKIKVIPNGFELNKFNRNEEQRENIRHRYNIDKETKVLISVGRWHPLKNYPNLLNAFRKVNNNYKDTKLMLVGTELDNNNCELLGLIRKYGLENYIILVGRKQNVQDYLSASDIFVLSSSGEAFPNVIGEAMACSLPVVTTDVGDCKYIVGDTGIAVKSEDEQALAKGIIKILNLSKEERIELGKKGRERVKKLFEIHKIVRDYENLYLEYLEDS